MATIEDMLVSTSSRNLISSAASLLIADERAAVVRENRNPETASVLVNRMCPTHDRA